ncbi:STP1 protein [Plasmodium malariae]|uniref:STP1 protein n=1 Tax=Plasmodium malariae TaxID=5858 RepID=A0A1A8X6N0_PLAMA|nr:STP1 protein [Plasmodium malariae]
MEECLSLPREVLGSTFFRFVGEPYFRRITQHIISKTSSLKDEKDKNKIREGCRSLANNLINYKSAPNYHDKGIWERVLYTWAKSYYAKLNKHGGCPVIMEERDLALLNLKYEVEDFCEEKEARIKRITCFKNGDIDEDNCDEVCSRKIKEYNEWINGKNMYFNNKKGPIINKCNTQPSHFPTRQCNILKHDIFKTFSVCKDKTSYTSVPSLPKGENKIVEVESQNTAFIPPSHKVSAEEDPHNAQQMQSQSEPSTSIQHDIQQESQIEPRALPSNEPPRTTDKSTQIQDMPMDQVEDSKTLPQPELENALPPSPNTLHHADAKVSLEYHSPATKSLSSEVSVPSSGFPNYNELSKILDTINSTYYSIFKITTICYYILIGMFKKKKIIKRRQVKFLRILVPSFSKNKTNLLIDDNLEYPIYDKEEIVKKIKINELANNLNSSKQKKDRSKTIIEVHMEVLEEFRNEEWENNKEEFLKICIDEFAKKNYKIYTNLIDYDLVTENIECINDNTKKNILWNKWVERHKNISEKLKKDDWFINLKNEWKKEQAYIKIFVELKKNHTNETQKVPFLEIEKDLWKHWISKKGIIIEQYLEQHWIKELEMDLNNMSDECVKEDTKNYVTLRNIEELQHQENYEELYKYIKKKLLTKLCILALMTMLEEYKKEVNFENKESYLDSCINEWKTEEYSKKTKNYRTYN